MSDITCVLCYRDVYFCSIGVCEHSVCFECSARMRVLLGQNECPICRQQLESVIFSKGRRSYKDLQVMMRRYIYLPRFGIYLEDDDLQDNFDALLEARCLICPEKQVFKDFNALRSHIQRQHELFPCDLCIDHIKLFPVERRFYTRAELAYHKRKGDKNDKSHRGHPLCKFCDHRYFDEDELYKHLRKDHYFCHFCDADGHNDFYNAYEDLRVHFRCAHFLCEEENCKDEKFTSVFRTEIDLKAHLASAHSRLLGKHGTKQARQLDLEFNLPPRSDDAGRGRRNYRGNDRGNDRRPEGPNTRDRDQKSDNQGAEDRLDGTTNREIVQVPSQKPPDINLESSKDFPTLDGRSGSEAPATSRPLNAISATTGGQSISQRLAYSNGMNVASKRPEPTKKPNWNVKVTGSNKMDEEFPALHPSSASRSSASSSSSSSFLQNRNPPGPSSFMNVTRIAAKPAPVATAKPRQTVPQSDDFPALGRSSASGNTNEGRGSAWSGSGVKMKQNGRGEYQGKKAPVPAPVLPKGPTASSSASNGYNSRDDDFKYVPLNNGLTRKANNYGEYQHKKK